jgi:putative ABC transport system permease protein
MSARRSPIFKLRPSALLRLYADRLQDHVAQELLAGAGIAVGVALLFGVLVANTSIGSSAGQLMHSITGSATLRIAARSSEGFDLALAERAGELPSVKVAAPLLRESATVRGPAGHEQVQLVGVTPAMIALHAEATRNLGAGAALLGSSGIGLPSSVGEEVGGTAGRPVRIIARGLSSNVPVSVVLGSQTVGAIANSPLAVALLPTAQRISGLQGRVTEAFIEPQPGKQRLAERELRRLAGNLNVGPVDTELRVLAQASGPNSESTTLFAAISAFVGILIALNAVLLTVPERRRWLVELLGMGFSPTQLVAVIAGQACILGLLGSLGGVAIGYLLSQTLFRALPVYLTFAFPLGANAVVQPSAVLIALAAGLAAALIASLLPLLDMLPRRAIGDVLSRGPGEPGQSMSGRTITYLAALSAALVVCSTGMVLLRPSVSEVAAILLACAAVMVIPAICAVTIRILARLSENIKGSMLALAADELRATAIRSSVLAGVAALVVYGLVAVGGARSDLTHGLNQAISQYLRTADLWVTPRGENVYTTESFTPSGLPAKIDRTPGVASVRLYDGALLDDGNRRIWVRARPQGDPSVLQSSQMIEGDYKIASRRIAQGGWAAVSGALAAEHHIKVGGMLTLATPSGQAHLRVAAVTTNAGWPPGAITLSAVDYRRYWQTSNPAAIEVALKPGVSPATGRDALSTVLADRPGLHVQTSQERESEFKGVARQALSRLSEISILLLVAGALAVAAALIGGIWLRRPQIAQLKEQGFAHLQILRLLLIESTAVIAIGCVDGALLGLYGHALADRWLTLTTGYPAPFSPGIPQLLLTIALIAAIALSLIALVGNSVARTGPLAATSE